MLEAADDGKLRKALKPQKPPKEKTTAVTLRLYNQGMSPQQIANERKISINTVFTHLTELASEGKVDANGIIAPDRREVIEKIVRMVGTDNGLTPIKSLCPPDMGWEELKFVIASMRKE